MRWTCPRCDREFGRANQSHVCVPGNTVADAFAGSPEHRAIYDAIVECVEQLGPYHADAVRVGVFLLSDRKFAEVRPKSRWLDVSLYLPRPIEHPRVVRTVAVSSRRTVSVVRLRTPADLDDDVRSWIADAYAEATS